MNKANFLAELSKKLKQIPKEERKKHLAYYSELIEDMIEDGMTEEEAVAKLDSPQSVAEQILAEQPKQEPKKAKTGRTVLNILLLVLGSPIWLPLLLAFFAVALSIYIVCWSLIIVMFSAVLCIGISVAALVLAAVLLIAHSVPLSLLALGCAILLAGIAILAFCASVILSKLLIRLTKAMGRRITALFKRKEAVK